jgi:hypothetical protein
MIDKMPITISVRIVAWASSDPGIVFNNSLIKLDDLSELCCFRYAKGTPYFCIKKLF